MPSGDLWKIFDELHAARPYNSLDGFKIKSHLGEVDVQEGWITQQDLEGNDGADTLAKQGGRMFIEGLSDYSCVFNFKSDIIVFVLQIIHQHLLKVHAFDKQRREDLSAAIGPDGEREQPIKIFPSLPSFLGVPPPDRPVVRSSSPRLLEPPTNPGSRSTLSPSFNHI